MAETITLEVENKEVLVSQAMLDAIHKRDRIEWAKNTLELHEEELPKPLNEFTDEELEDYGYQLDLALSSDCGNIESRVITEMFYGNIKSCIISKMF